MHYKPYHKPSKEFIPLHEESAHPAKCHARPLAECMRFARTSSDAFVYSEQHLDFIHRLVEMQVNGEIIARAVNMHNSWYNIVARRSKVVKPTTHRIVALVLEHHPVLVAAQLPKVIDNVLDHFRQELGWILLKPIKIKVAWRVTPSRLSTCFRH